jgi:hypothetical protein
MDLSTVKKKLVDDMYETALEFKNDVILIFKNALVFNPINTQVFRDAVKLLNYFVGKFKDTYPALAIAPTAMLNDLEYHKVERTFIHLETLTCINEFRYRVNPTTLPGYYLTIDKPIDFGSIKSKWASMKYGSLDEVEADMKLMFRNCFEYNASPELAIHQKCIVLEREFKGQWEERPKIAPVILKVKPVVLKVEPVAESLAATPVVERQVAAPVAAPQAVEMDRYTRDQCALLLDKLVEHPASMVFRFPVDPIALGIPQYAEIVTHPMDFSTIEGKLSEYRDVEAFLADVRLVFTACYQFNPPGMQAFE